MKKITWLHISDLHIDASEDRDNSVVREAFLKDIDKRLKDDISFDFVVVTGDVANKGKKKDYLIANDFFKVLLGKLELDENRLFVVPGNHDINIAKISKKNGGAFLNELVDGQNNTRINDIIDSAFLEPCKHKFADYYKNISQNRYNVKNKLLGNYYEELEVNGEKIGIAGVNSAWLSQGKGAIENTHMAVGENQIRELVDWDSLNKNVLNICLYHHPMSAWLEFDKTKGLLKSKFDFLICGHFHEPGNTIDTINSSIELQAAALYNSREYHNGYSICEYYPERSEDNVILTLRMYSDNDGGFFAPDNISYKNAVNGVVSFTLKKK